MNIKNPFFELKVGPSDTIINPQREIPVLEGYKPLEGLEDYHVSLKRNIDEWFEKFPNCCKTHKELAKNPVFRKEDYDWLPELILQKICYSEYHISKRAESQFWYEDITDYFRAVEFSFGSPPLGFHLYYHAMVNFIENLKEQDFRFPKSKRKKLIQFLNRGDNPTPKKSDLDLNQAFTIIQRWVSSFPDLVHFKEMKERYKGKFLFNLVFYNEKYNPYSGMSRFDFRTRKELMELLLQLTKNALAQVDTPLLIERGAIPPRVKYIYNLNVEKHRKRQAVLLERYAVDEKKYIRVMNKWVDNEITFFKDEDNQRYFEELKKSSSSVGQNLKPKLSKGKIKYSMLDFFKGDVNRMKRFVELLKGQSLKALNENNQWIMTPDNSLCACFDALFVLNEENQFFLIDQSKKNKKADLYRMIEEEFSINCSYDNFKKWRFDIDIQIQFQKVFKLAFIDSSQ